MIVMYLPPLEQKERMKNLVSSQHALANTQVEETVQMPESSWNTSSAFDSDPQAQS